MSNITQVARRGAGAIFNFVILMLFGLGMMVLPFVASAIIPGLNIPFAGQVILAVIGLVALVAGLVLTVMARLYHTATADEAFVKNGRGGEVAVIDGGKVIIPKLHTVTYVTLRNIKAEVDRTQPEHVLRSKENLPVKVKVQFFFKVPKVDTMVKAAAQSFGSMAENAEFIKEQIIEKLDGALRDVAATKTLEELNANREQFRNAVVESLKPELQHNGLELETAVILVLDQAPIDEGEMMKNVFLSGAMRNLAQTIQANRVETTKITTEADQEVKAREVESRKKILEQEVALQKAEAEANLAKAKAQATQDAESAKAAAEAKLISDNAKAQNEQAARAFKAEQDKKAGEAEAVRDQAVKVAQAKSAEAVAVAEQKKLQATATAEVEKNQAVEVADRKRQVAIAKAEQEQAQAEAERFLAQKEREAAEQLVQTTVVTATAEREKRKAIIEKEAAAEQAKVEREMEARLLAYAKVTEAQGEQDAAEKKAAATIRLATADQEAAALRAKGLQAEQMVPVTVAREQVNVKDAEVTVLQRKLEAEAANASVSVSRETALAQIEANKQVGIAHAQAAGEAMKNAHVEVYGTPETAAAMFTSLASGKSMGNFVTGLSTDTPKDVKDAALGALDNITGGVGGAIKTFAERIAGKKLDDAELLALLQNDAIREALTQALTTKKDGK